MPAKPTHTCLGCGRPSGRGKQPAPGAGYYCMSCRRTGMAVQHGTDRRYSMGCRCDVCRESKNRRMREYAVRRRGQGRPLWGDRPAVDMSCEWCGSVFAARLDQRNPRFCSRQCSRLFQAGGAIRPRNRFRIASSTRFGIYERDGWTCQLCLEPVDPAATDMWRPTLDHIVPQSHQLIPDHSPSNLRLAHGWCNSVRGDGRYHVDFFEEAS